LKKDDLLAILATPLVITIRASFQVGIWPARMETESNGIPTWKLALHPKELKNQNSLMNGKNPFAYTTHCILDLIT